MIKSRYFTIVQFNYFIIKFFKINFPFSHIRFCNMEYIINILLFFRVKKVISIFF